MKNKKTLLSLTSLLMLLAGCSGNSSEAVNPSEKPSENTPITALPTETPTVKPTESKPFVSPSVSEPQITYYTVTFDLDGGSIIDESMILPQKVQEGHWAKKPSVDPTKDHCTFLGWFDTLDDTKFSFSQGIRGDVNLKAKWKVNDSDKITLHFNPNNGEQEFDVETFLGDYPSVPTPKKEGRVFKGWYINGEADKRWTGFVVSDLVGKTLVALYEKQSFNYRYEFNADGQTICITGLIKIDTAIVDIPETINGHLVTKIGDKAFQSRISITEINIPKTITDISPKAFLGTRYLKKITVDSANKNYKSRPDGTLFTKDGLTLVCCPNKAYSNSATTTTYTCPSTLKKIGDYAFYGQGDSGITGIVFNDGLEEIGSYAFYECYAISNLSFPDTLKKIGDYAFERFTSTTVSVNIDWGEGLEEIGASAFVGVYRKETLTFPDSLKKIGDYAFTSTEDTPCAITKVNLPASLEYFGNAAFFYGYGIKNITLSASNPNFKIVNNRLLSKDGTKLYWVPSDTANLIQAENILTIPDGVTELRPHCLSEARFITSVELPKSLKIIGEDAFHYNYAIQDLDIPNSVVTIGAEAFRRMEKLQTITIGNKVTEIGEGAFFECTKLNDVVIPSAVKKIGKEAFAECSSLSDITFNEGLTEIGEKAFALDKKLVELSLPNSLTTIGNSAFSDCSGLTTVKFGTGLTSFGSYVFGGNDTSMPKITSRTVKGNGSIGPKVIDSTLISADGKTVYYCSPTFTGTITIPSGVEKINSSAYAYVKAKGLNLGSSLKEIGEGAFRSAFNYSSQITATFPASLEKIDDGAFYFSNLNGATFNEGLKSIGVGAFSSTDLGDVTFPSTLESIDRQAFFASGISSITFKEGITTIGEEAFLANPGLKGAITIPASLTTLGSGAFTGRNNSFTNGITEFKVAEGSKFAVKDTALYDKDFTKLYAYPSSSAITSITLPETVTEIDSYAFAGAKNLTSVTLNNGLQKIGEFSFACSTKLNNLSIPNTVTSIGYRSFLSWTKTQTISFPWTQDQVLRTLGDDWANSTNATIQYQG